MTSSRLVERFLIIGLLTLLFGCGKSGGVERASVSGTVTLDGAAVPDGTIVFRPVGDTKGPMAGAKIENGRYLINHANGPVFGKHRVEVSAFTKTGRKVASRFGGVIDEAIESMPERYNSSSTLVATIKPGKNTLDFELTTK